MDLQKFIEKNLTKRSALSYILFPLSLIYGKIQKIRRYYYGKFPALSYESSKKIISVGNIVSGGSGKTPFVIFLANYLTNKGKKVAISHRGYKGDFEDSVKIISDKESIYTEASRAGDEAFLIANSLKGIPVVVGKNRKFAVRTLEKRFPDLDYIILDDSFQHLKVKHNIDFILFNETSRLGNGFVLPAGLLREPLSSIKFADIIVWNGDNIPDNIKVFQKDMLKAIYKLAGYYDKNEIPIKKIIGDKNILVSGIGTPKSFENLLQKNGVKFFKHFIFADHYEYTQDSLRKIEEFAKANFIKNILVTEKDWSKIKFIENNLNLVIVKARFEILDVGVLGKL